MNILIKIFLKSSDGRWICALGKVEKTNLVILTVVVLAL